eukprot:TRINITY_DN14695_c0_g1_i9.p2 TRINITY_DN14695_c0_g1~~TRINITY_DN14695_c0_g1_i9.p2  ORF type:complete len:105 (-),score=33.99 TRINITY_DN14695_c0_g1_i9:69-383(-)
MCIRDRSLIRKPPTLISKPVSYTHLRAHETPEHLVCRLLLEKKKKKTTKISTITNNTKQNNRSIMKKSIFNKTLSLIHISEPTRLLSISYAVFCLKKKKKKQQK